MENKLRTIVKSIAHNHTNQTFIKLTSGCWNSKKPAGGLLPKINQFNILEEANKVNWKFTSLYEGVTCEGKR